MKTRLSTIRTLLVLPAAVFAALASGCGDDGSEPTVDAASSNIDAAGNAADAMPNGPDAMPSAQTPCGAGTCDEATQICINDVAQNEACVARPAGCDDRNCADAECSAACGVNTCFDLAQANTIACH